MHQIAAAKKKGKVTLAVSPRFGGVLARTIVRLAI
jgi:hypothetical protein